MKKVACVLIFIFLIGLVNAISTNLKQTYEQGETIITEISGNILNSIDSNNVEFRRGHVLIPLEYDFKKLGNKYFLWATAPQNENNYSLVIKDIITNIAGRTEEIDFEQNFSVSGNLTDYFIIPGFIIAKEDFSVDIELNNDFEKTINVDFPSLREIILKPGKNKIDFSIVDVNETKLFQIAIGKYSFLAYIISKPKEVVNGNDNSEKIVLEFNPKIIESVILLGEKAVYPFQIINLGNQSVSGIRLGYNGRMFTISPLEYDINLDSKGAIELNLSFIGNVDDRTKEKGIREIISINFENYSLEMPVFINFTEKKEEVKTPYLNNYTEIKYCSELKGIICTAGEICDAGVKISLEGACCIGKCKEPESGNSKSWIGYLIAGVLLILIIYIFLRYRKTKSRAGLEKTLGVWQLF